MSNSLKAFVAGALLVSFGLTATLGVRKRTVV